MHLPYLKILVLDLPGYRNLERRTRWHGVKPQHLVHLPSILVLALAPIIQGPDIFQTTHCQPVALSLEIGRKHFIAGRLEFSPVK